MRRTQSKHRTVTSRTRAGFAATAAALVATATLAACGDATAPHAASISDAQIAADVATIAGAAVANDVVDFRDDETAAGVGGAGGCPYDAASQKHVCTAVTERGLTVTRTYQFRDAAETPTQSYDATNTASIYFTRSVEGTLSGSTSNGATWTSATHRADQRTVSGLLGAETQRVWNGTGASHDTTDYTGSGGGTRHYAGDASYQAQNVVMALPHSSFPYPQSGTITRTVNLTVTSTAPGANTVVKALSREVTVTFNGTALVPLQVNAVSCTLNLETQKVSGCTQTVP